MAMPSRIPENSRNIIIKSPYCCKNTLIFAAPAGKNLNNIQEPSRGGMGIKLNIPSKIFKNTTIPSKSIKGSSWGTWTNLIINPKTMAKAKFAATPAMETFKVPHFLSLKLYGFTGTGFAHPKINGCPPGKRDMSINRRGRITEPKGSKCFIGFRVRRPAYFAVGSPKE